MSGKIFINYRRGDEPGFTHALFGQLEQTFSKDRLFMDVDSISPGIDFVREIDDQVSKCKILLAVIGPGWLNFADADTGERRLDNESDYVRIEIEAALNRDIRVIPVLINGAEMPPEASLPDGLQSLARRNAIRISHDRFRTDVQRLTSSVQEALGEVAPSAPVPRRHRPAWNVRTLGLLGLIGLGVALGGLYYVWNQNWRYQLLGTFEGKDGYVDTIDITSDGRLAVSAGIHPLIWQIASRRTIRKYTKSHRTLLSTIALSYDDNFLATGGCKIYDDIESRCAQSEIKVWDFLSGKLIRTIDAHPRDLNVIIFLPNGNFLSGGCGDVDDKGKCVRGDLRLWSAVSGALVRNFSHSDSVYTVASSPDGKTLITGTVDSVVRQWDVSSGTLIRSFDGHDSAIKSVAYLPDGRSFISGSADKTIKLWREKFVDAEITYKGHRGTIRSIDISPDGQRIVSGGKDGTMRLWDTQSGRLIHTFEGHKKQVTVVKFTPNGQKALSGSWDKTVKIWDVRSLTQRLGF